MAGISHAYATTDPIFFVGGAVGSAITSPVFGHFGWGGLCVVGAVLPLLALGYFCAVLKK